MNTRGIRWTALVWKPDGLVSKQRCEQRQKLAGLSIGTPALLLWHLRKHRLGASLWISWATGSENLLAET